jgi:Putative Actinobacterial Holin-X, holin superfamily III
MGKVGRLDGPDVKIHRSIGTLLADRASQTILTIRQELALLRAELNEKFSRTGQGATPLAAGALALFSGWLVLLAAAVLGLATIVPAWLAALILGLVVSAVGAALICIGKRRVDVQSLLARRTGRSVREDEAWLRERLE